MCAPAGGTDALTQKILQQLGSRRVAELDTGDGSLCCFSFNVFLFLGGWKPPPGWCLSLDNWLIVPENKGKSALHGQRRELSPVLMFLFADGATCSDRVT